MLKDVLIVCGSHDSGGSSSAIMCGGWLHLRHTFIAQRSRQHWRQQQQLYLDTLTALSY